MATRVKVLRVSFSTQATVLVELPDIPGLVVEVRQVNWYLESFSAETAVALRLYHNIDLSVTLAFARVPGDVWWSVGQAVGTGGPSPVQTVYDPPFDLIGAQRFDHVASAGTVIGHLVIHYTTRRESNRTLWNDLRARTSFERG